MKRQSSARSAVRKSLVSSGSVNNISSVKYSVMIMNSDYVIYVESVVKQMACSGNKLFFVSCSRE